MLNKILAFAVLSLALLLQPARVSARTLCHYFAVILSAKYDKKKAKYGNITTIQNPP